MFIKTLLMLKKWEEKYDSLHVKKYWKNDNGLEKWFTNQLEESGFVCIGTGETAYVYKHPEENCVIKYCQKGGNQINFFAQFREYDKPFALPYLLTSLDGFCAIQKFVDCSREGQRKAMKLINKTHPFNKNIKNMGMDGSKPVIIDVD